jgi:uncharacterized protein YPO0396
LTAVRLINWYHYSDETMPVSGNTLLCGNNGSGKTTVLDALQLALVGDASECEFNRAAQSQSRGTIHRSVLGYVRYQTGDTDDSRGGKWEYAREVGTTGYIALEFRDRDHPEYDFTAGLVIDAKETTFDKAYFLMPSRRVSDLPALTAQGEVRPIREFRVAARALDIKLPADARSYRSELRHRLGLLPDSFHRLIVKALEFKPMATVRDFVFRYLADPKPIDSQPLIDNIEHYRQMDQEAKDAEVKITALAEICRQGEVVQRERRLADQYNFLVLRAGMDVHRERIAACDQESAVLRSQQDRAVAALEIARDRVKVYRDEAERLQLMLAGSATHRRITQLKAELARVEDEIKDAEDAARQLAEVAVTQLAVMDLLTSPEAREARRVFPDLVDGRSAYGEAELPEGMAELRDRLVRDRALRGHDLRAWEMRTATIQDHLTLVKERFAERATALREEGRLLNTEQQELNQGRVQYPEGARGLIEHLQRNVKGAAPVRVLCEVIEVPNERWRDAAEAALGARRLYMLVDPASYQSASRQYENFRRAGNRVFGTGIVDLDRVRRDGRRARPGSLAEQITTDDPDARAYVDYLLGDLICVDAVSDLRSHTRAITDTGAMYGSAAQTNTDPRALDRRYIGRAARERRLDEIGARLRVISAELLRLNEPAASVERHLRQVRTAVQALRTMEMLLPEADQLGTRREQARTLDKTLAGIDRGTDAALEEQLDLVRSQIKEAEEKRDSALRAENDLVGRLATLGRDRGEAVAAQESAEREWREAFPLDRLTEVELGSASDPWREFETRYQAERENRSPVEIRTVFLTQQKSCASRIEKGVNLLVKLKEHFNATHYEVAEESDEGYVAYREQKIIWEESRLPEYRKEIATAQALAVRQMGEDIVCKLHEHFMQLRQDIRDLNAALRDLTFGTDRFEFQLDVASSKRDYYDVITQAARQPLSSVNDPERSLFDGHVAPAESLAANLTGLVEQFLRARNDQVKTVLEEMTDYREYFTYDLRITNVATGKAKSYDTVAGLGSGGEVQSALYIAFLASLYQMYRANTRDRRPRCGLVLLDEAFGKNDGRRIAATLRFARQVGLQLVLAMPAERMDLLGPQMDMTLYLHKEDATGVPAIIDFTKDFADEALTKATLEALEAEEVIEGAGPATAITAATVVV